MLQMKLTIVGTVQRVGFRYSVIQYVEKNKLELKGFVRNLPDGSVEILAQGGIEELKLLHRFALKGPDRAIVREVKDDFTEIAEWSFDSFDVLD
jgi:acylphosphatase